jgi:predicted transcriptional regulator
MTTTKKQTTATIDVTSDAKEQLEERARTTGKTVAEIVEALLARFREEEAEEAAFEAELQEEHEAGLRSAEEEGVVEHDRVSEWIRSLGTANPLPLPTPMRTKA